MPPASYYLSLIACPTTSKGAPGLCCIHFAYLCTLYHNTSVCLLFDASTIMFLLLFMNITIPGVNVVMYSFISMATTYDFLPVILLICLYNYVWSTLSWLTGSDSVMSWYYWWVRTVLVSACGILSWAPPAWLKENRNVTMTTNVWNRNRHYLTTAYYYIWMGGILGINLSLQSKLGKICRLGSCL